MKSFQEFAKTLPVERILNAGSYEPVADVKLIAITESEYNSIVAEAKIEEITKSQELVSSMIGESELNKLKG